MKILLTGSSGFFGKNFIKRIKKNVKILAIQRSRKNLQKNINYIFCDIKKIKLYQKKILSFNPDVILHFAWEGIPDYSKKNCAKNLSISKKIVNIAFSLPSVKKIILLGSCFEYDFQKGKCVETFRSNCSSNISECKEKLLTFFLNKYKKKHISNNISWYWIRPFYIFGEFQRKDSLIPTIIKNLKLNKNISLNNPSHCNDYLYVGEFINFIKKVIFSKIDSGIYNIGSGKLFSNQSILDICKKIFNKQNSITLKYEKFSKGKYSCNKKINKINFYPKINIYNGLKKTILKYEN